jgi:hypothetical protein
MKRQSSETRKRKPAVVHEFDQALFDSNSIMPNMFPPELFTYHKGTNNNTAMLTEGKAFIARMYPH